MVVIVEFTLDAESFLFGRSTSGNPNFRVQLERVVPVQDGRIPFIWVTGQNHDQFEHRLERTELVTQAEALTRMGDSVLYYVEWQTDEETFLNGLAENGGTIMEAHGDSEWSFTVRFQDSDALTDFHQFYRDEEFPVRIDRISSLDGNSHSEYGFGLTRVQRETLIMAVRNGYFSIPRETTLEEIANELSISSQAASERIRRGAETVLRKALVGLVATDLKPSDD
jgi:predicted DNA binding protein